MTLTSDLFGKKVLISRVWLRHPAIDGGGSEVGVAVVSPAKAAVGRVSAVGSGGWFTRSPTSSLRPGGGGAFARTKFPVNTPGEAFTAYVGNPYKNITDISTYIPNGDGSSRFVRNTGSVLLCKAAAAVGVASGNITFPHLGRGGLASDSVGDTKRDGATAALGSNVTGASAGDDQDFNPLGFGWPGVSSESKTPVCHGAGGIGRYLLGVDSFEFEITPGCGEICIEWFTEDPGY